MIRGVKGTDIQEICHIYNHYIQNTIITFEEVPISEQEMEERISEITPIFPWVVWEEEGKILGYAYARPFYGRSAYKKSAELIVYLEKESTGKEIGSYLYQWLIDDLKDREIHALMGGVSLPNSSSQNLHEKFGFKKVAHFKEVGYKLGRWVDVGYWQLLLV